MRAHMLIAATAALAVATAAPAEPPKAPVQQAAQPADRPAEVLVASVENVRPEISAAAQDAAAPPKRARKARVNSCRCGDQSPPNE